MSRSYRKHDKFYWCSTDDDKWYRNQYHREERRKTKYLLNKQIKLGTQADEMPSEKITNGIDRSLNFSDKFMWGSDGGAHFGNTISDARKEFEMAVFSVDYKYIKNYMVSTPENVWEKYNHYINKVPKGTWYFFDFLFSNHIIPFDFDNPEKLIDWLRENEEKIIRQWLRAKNRK